jgi:haloalkane dehalogenase
MWGALQDALAEAGIRSVAPDLIGFGETPRDRPATWANQIDALERLCTALDLEKVALVGHDWGTLIGLRWACDNPERIAALVISDGGFFHDGKWNAMAKILRTEGEGEQLVEGLNRELMGQMLTAVCPEMTDAAIDAYWAPFEAGHGRQAALDLYRSGDFAELEPYQGRLAELGVPTLLLWGGKDAFAPVAGAHRFSEEIPHAQLEVLHDLDHFCFDEDPERTSAAVREFLESALVA